MQSAVMQRRLFTFLKNLKNVNAELPQFLVGFENGFLPRQDPLAKLPEKFSVLESILQRMPIKISEGQPGLLARGQLGSVVERELPLINVSDIKDTQLLAALFRDYTFLASAYLLEPCDIQYRKNKSYGIGRHVLPKNIAVPLNNVSKLINAKPFMEYALSYSLYNWKRINQEQPPFFENLKLIRSFEGGESEAGFILVHVSMVANSAALVRSCVDLLNAAKNNNREAFNAALESILGVMKTINMEFETMWKRSSAPDYDRFRTFIMGTKNQPMFPKGVIYEGVSNEPMFFRGESGANDTMIPTLDSVFELTAKMPNNPLTTILKDFRSYRPQHHAEWIKYVESEAQTIGIRKFVSKDSTSSLLYLACLDQIRDFRARHWNLTKEYILKYSNHPVATGGSPIVTWLPNQLSTVLKIMDETGKQIIPGKLSPNHEKLHNEIASRADIQLKVLEREVSALKSRYPGQDL